MIDNDETYQRARRWLRIYLLGLLGVCLTLGVLHLLYADHRAGGVYWLNLDKERNLPTWISGLLFMLFGLSALMAGLWESHQNRVLGRCFRFPLLWLVVAAGGLLMSLDEMTILHENLFWREVRVASGARGDAWTHLTQWQIVFAPAIFLAFGYFALFFGHRFRHSPGAWRASWAGVGCWMGALLLEGLRGAFKLEGDTWYTLEVVIEEMLEMVGALFLVAAVLSYVIDISVGLTAERRERLTRPSRWMSGQVAKVLGLVIGGLVLSGGAIFYFAQRQAEAGAPMPTLMKRALRAVDASTPPAAPRNTPAIWFDDVESGSAPIEPRWIDALRVILRHRLQAGAPIPSQALAALMTDTEPRAVFVSVSDSKRRAQVRIGTGRGLHAALSRALEALDPKPKVRPATPWVRLDIVDRTVGTAREGYAARPDMERGIEGLALPRATGVAFHGSQVLTHGFVSKRGKIRRKRIRRYTKQQHPALGDRLRQGTARDDFVTYTFTTQALFLEARPLSPSPRSWPLYRGHRQIEPSTPGPLRQAATAAGLYLARETHADGQMTYIYRPKSDLVIDEYNMLRHAGAVYALLQLHAVAPDAERLAAAERALAYMLESIEPCRVGERGIARQPPPPFQCLLDESNIKLGGNALAVIALAQHWRVTGEPRHRQTVEALLGWIRASQSPGGEFEVHKQRHPSGERRDFVSAYYPGEALLALVRAYPWLQDHTLLDAAERGAQWLIETRDRDVPTPDLAHDHWLLLALEALHTYRPDPRYVDHALRIAEAIIGSQIVPPAPPGNSGAAPAVDARRPPIDRVGSYYDDARSTPAATRTEGLVAAYGLARAANRTEMADAIRRTMARAVGFQLGTQFGPPQAMFLPDPARVLGGFHRSLTNFEIRIDYVQHNISALLGYAAILDTVEP